MEGGVGGGIDSAKYGAITLNNCLVAGSAQFGGDIASVVSGHNNIVDDLNNAGGLTAANHNQYIPTNKLFFYQPAFNGGPTKSMAPVFHPSQDPMANQVSPLLGAGDPSLIPAGVTTDQRGVARISLNGTVDVGSVERSAVGTLIDNTPVHRPNVIVVTTLTDEDNGGAEPELGAGTSLREAINLANADPGGDDIITFAPGLTGTLDLTMGALPGPTATMTMVGPGANQLSIDAMGQGGILSVPSGTNLVVSGLTLTGAGGGPSAIVNGGLLTMDACAVVGNQATNGGGINNTGTLTVTNSTFSANKAFLGGGAVFSQGPLTMTNCTLTGNTAGEGGGVLSESSAPPTITNCTIVGNYGGIAGNVTLNNTIVAQSGAAGDLAGVVSGSNNLVDDPATAGSLAGRLVNGVNGNIVGLDPMLGPLTYNGGPTKTMVPLSGSPAIEGGDSALVPAGVLADQRGTLRIKGSAVCIGSVEVGPLIIVVTSLADTEQRGTLRQSIEAALAIDPTDPIVLKFADGLTGTLTLTNGPLPAIAMDVAIVGPGARFSTIDGNSHGNIFTVQAGATLTLVGLTLAHGQTRQASASAGCITNLGTLTLRDCAIDGNTGTGGGIANFGSLTMLGCTLSNNTSYATGGGLYNAGTATLYNCTLYKNYADIYGGGIYNSASGTLTLDDCTVAANSGGGIDNASATAVTLNNSIVAHSAFFGDVAGPVAANSTLIGDLNPLDPMLGTLGYYGGPTKTLPLRPGSPAIAAGNTTLLPADLIIDQRGALRVNASGKLDQGAFQSGPTQILVTTRADLDNGSIDLFNATGVSLREAINFANADPSGGDTILFSPALSGTLTLTDGALPTISAAMTIQGPGANVLTIDAHGQSRILELSASANLTLSGLTLANGSAYTGGGIFNSRGGTLTLVGCTVSGCKATGASGGGIVNYGTLTLTDSTLSGNSASLDAGALYNVVGTLSLTNCTVSGNTAQTGAALYLIAGTNSLADCTISGNTSTGSSNVPGVLLRPNVTTATVNDTIIAGNNGAFSGAYDISGSATGSNNLIGTGSVTGSNNQLGVTDPKLGLLAWNGGPTQTVALQPGSPAIGAGNALSVTKDQRGIALDAPNADIGAFQFQGPPPSVTVSGPTTGTIGIDLPFTFTATEPTPNPNAMFTYNIDWNGDGSDVETVQGPGNFKHSHAYQAKGPYKPNVTVVDQNFRSSAPAVGVPVQLDLPTVQSVGQTIVTVSTVQITTTTPTNFSAALNTVDQVPANEWGSSNVADIKLQGGASSLGAVVNASPNANINVSGTQDAKQRLNNITNFTLFASGDATVNQLEIGAFIVAVSIVGAASGAFAEGLTDVEVSLADFTTEAEEGSVATPLQTSPTGAGLEAAPKVDQAGFTAAKAALKWTNTEGAALIGGGNATVAFVELGGSPALTVEDGNVTWSNAIMGTQTDAPTVLVKGGTLDLTDDIVSGDLTGSQPLIEVDGGKFILGSADGTNGDVLGTYNDGAFIHVALDGEVIVEPGNGFGLISNNGNSVQAAGATSVQLVSSLPVATPGQTVTFTATVTANGAPATDGSVEFFDDTTGAFLGMVPVNNGSASVQATFNDATSGDTIYATYLPKTGALAPSSGHTTQQVSNATKTTLTGPSSSPTYGQTVTFTATVALVATSGGAPTGAVEFFDGTTDLGPGTALSGSGNSATSTFTIATLTAGSHAIKAVYMPTGLFVGSFDTLDVTVNQATPTLNIKPVNITFGTALANGQLSGASASWTVGGTVVSVTGTFAYNSPGTVLGAGAGQSRAVTFTPDDTIDYTSATGSVIVNVAQATPSVKVTDASGPYNQNPFVATATVAGVNGVFASSLEGVTPTLAYYSGSTASGTQVPAPVLPGTYTVKASFAGSADYAAASATATFTIQNPAPSIVGPTIGVPGQPLTYTFAISGPTQGIVFSISYGDGTSVKTAAGGPTIKLDHIYTATGSFTIQVTATDKNSVVSPITKQTVKISSVAMEVDPSGGTALAVGGSAAGGNTITVTATDTTGKALDVTINSTDFGTFKPTGHLFVYGQGGKNSITLKPHAVGVTSYIKVPAFLYAEGSGGDKLSAVGSAANNVLTGHGNNEVLICGKGRDLLIGGTGAATLNAGAQDDILIGGWTNYDISSSGMTYDQKLATLEAIMAEWGSSDSYSTRLNKLAGSLNTNTVHDNVANGVAVADQLFGNPAANDWFFAGVNDTVTGKNSNDVTTKI